MSSVRIGNGKAVLTITEHGGLVVVYGIDGQSLASLGVDKRGGRVNVFGKTKINAAMGINEYGDGAVTTWDKNG